MTRSFEYMVDICFEDSIIYTADAQNTVAEVLVVQDGNIIFVGSTKDGAPYKEVAKEVVD
ncbi:MAG: hypothetical protein FWF19_02845 [Euryarchaeota archaeon]|nr:hypothetical protein [Euryarchaeota archaeon]